MPGMCGSTILNVCPTCRGTRYFTCLDCKGTGKKDEWYDAAEETSSREEQAGLIVSLVLLEKIREEAQAGRITEEHAADLVKWCEEFVAAFALPLSERAERMRAVIKKGRARFRDVALFDSIAASVGLTD